MHWAVDWGYSFMCLGYTRGMACSIHMLDIYQRMNKESEE